MALPAIAAGALRIGSMFVRGSSTFVKGASRGVGRSGGMLRRAILKKTKVKRENIVSRKVFNKRIKEKRRRMSKEQALETFKTRGKSGAPNVPGKSFLQRILDFIGILLVGWLVDKLPKIIKWVQNLIERIRKLVDSLKSFIKNLGDWFKSIGSIVSAGWDNIRNFDFTDQSGKLKKAMTDMENAFKGMQTDIEGMKNALTGDMSASDTRRDTGSGGGEFSTEITDDERAALSVLAKYESGAAGYDAVNQGGSNDGRAVLGYSGDIKGMPQHGGRSLTDMTIGEIKQLQYDDKSMSMSEWFAAGKLHAVGRYQFIGNTLPGVAARAGFGDDVKFTKAVQDKMAIQLIKERGISPWVGPSDKATPAERQLVRKVQMQEGGSGGKYSYGGGNVIEYITGDRGHPNFEYRGHGRESNYHDHIAFRTIQDKERAKAALRAAGIQIGSEFRPGDRGWHGENLAIDIPGAQWGGSGAIGQREFNGSAKVRQVLINAGFGGSGLGFGTRGTSTSIARSTGKMPDIGYSTGPKNTIIIVEEEAPTVMMGGGSRGSSPVIVMGSSLNSIMKRKLLTDLAYT